MKRFSPYGERTVGDSLALPKRPEVDNIEGIHYVVGEKPLKSFRQPIIDPKDYEHVITLYNGSVAVYYREYSSIENLQLLGENYIKQMKLVRTLFELYPNGVQDARLPIYSSWRFCSDLFAPYEIYEV